jgi:hypothetical protein
MDKFRAKQNTVCKVGGIKCPCCNDFNGKDRAELNQIARARMKEDLIKIQGIEYEEDNNESRYETEEQLLNRENLNLLIDKYMSLDYPIEIKEEEDFFPNSKYFYVGQSACSATGDTVEEALTELEGVKLDVITYMIRAGKEIPLPSMKENNKTGIRNFLDSCPDYVEIATVTENHIVIDWSFVGIGFGELTIFKSKKDGKWKIDTETMGKKVAKEVLGLLVDSLEKVG